MRVCDCWLAFMALKAATGFGVLHAAELQLAADSAWQAYSRTVDARMQMRLDAGDRFLWIDEDRARKLQVRNGAILVAPGMGNGTQNVPDGLIHHWIAAAFTPQANVASVLRIAHGYADYKQFYQPAIVDSKLLASTGGGHSFSMRSLTAAVLISGTKRTAEIRHLLKAGARLSATDSSWANLHGSKASRNSLKKLLPRCGHGLAILQ